MLQAVVAQQDIAIRLPQQGLRGFYPVRRHRYRAPGTLRQQYRLIAHQGNEVWCYPLDEEKEIRDAMEAGVTGLITNRPDVARKVVSA